MAGQRARRIQGLTVALVILAAEQAPASAQEKAESVRDALSAAGLNIVAEVKGVCPKEPPLRLDCNADGMKDHVIPGSHSGDLEGYPHPDSIAIGFGAFAGLGQMYKVLGRNKNFRNVAAVDGKSQQVLWSVETDGLIAHSAVSDDGRLLFVASHDDHVYALDLRSGARIWSQDLKKNIFGLFASERAVVAVTGADAVYAYDPEGGSVLWSKPARISLVMPGFGVMLADASRVYIASLDDRLIALDWTSGETLWESPSEGNASIRAIAEGSLLVAEKKGLKAYDLESGTLRWSLDAGSALHVQPLIDLGGAVAFHNGRGGKKAAIMAVQTDTGELLWSRRLERASVDKKRVIHVPEDYYAIHTRIGVQRDAGGKARIIYVPDSKGLNAINASDGAVLWNVPARNIQYLDVTPEAVYVADSRGVIQSISTSTGTPLWSFDTDGSVYQVQALGNAILATLFSRDLVVLAAGDGQIQARQALGEPYRLMPYGPDRVIVCGEAASWVVEKPQAAIETGVAPSSAP